MALRLTLRFILLWLASTTAAASLMLMFEAVMRAELTFSLGVIVVLPLLFAAWVSGNSWVSQRQTPAPASTVMRYGGGFALLALSLCVIAGDVLAQTGWIDVTFSNLAMLASRPGLTSAVLALAFATCALITTSGFFLGARAAARLLPLAKK